MKTYAGLKNTDAPGVTILLIFLFVLCGMLIYSQGTQSILDESNSNDTDEEFRNTSIKAKCYSIPYTRDEILQIAEEGNKEELSRIRWILYKKSYKDDLTNIVGPPRIEYKKEDTSICLDLQDPIKEERNSSKYRVV